MDPTFPPSTSSYSFILFQVVTSGDLPSIPRNLNSKFRGIVGAQAFLNSPGCAVLWLCHWLAKCVTLDKGFSLSQASASSCVKWGPYYFYPFCRNVFWGLLVRLHIQSIQLQCMVQSRLPKYGKYNNGWFSFFNVLGYWGFRSHQRTLVHHWLVRNTQAHNVHTFASALPLCARTLTKASEETSKEPQVAMRIR